MRPKPDNRIEHALKYKLKFYSIGGLAFSWGHKEIQFFLHSVVMVAERSIIVTLVSTASIF